MTVEALEMETLQKIRNAMEDNSISYEQTCFKIEGILSMEAVVKAYLQSRIKENIPEEIRNTFVCREDE